MANFSANGINSTEGDITGPTAHVQIMFPFKFFLALSFKLQIDTTTVFYWQTLQNMILVCDK